MLKKLVAIAAFTLVASPALAQSAKYTMELGTITRLAPADTQVVLNDAVAYEGPWTTILDSKIKTSSQKDLVMGVALEAGLTTDTSVASSRYVKDTSTAEGTIEVRVLVDGKATYPGDVVFAKRLQSLWAKFDGFSCIDALTVDTDLDGVPDAGDGIVTYDECSWTNEEIGLLQKTMSANAFFFALDDVGTGVHEVKVQARLSVSASSQQGAAQAVAWVGKGALTVEEVRLVKDSVINMP